MSIKCSTEYHLLLMATDHSCSLLSFSSDHSTSYTQWQLYTLHICYKLL